MMPLLQAFKARFFSNPSTDHEGLNDTYDASHGERGNVFFALFGAVAIVGVIGAASMGIMRGPLTTMVEVNKRTQAESQMQLAGRIAILQSAEQTASGDCDADGFIEPLIPGTFGTAPGGALVNGGALPSTVGATKTDPWGTEYGYCVWNAGTTSTGAGCNAALIEGSGTGAEDYAILSIVSAGPDRRFDTDCRDFASTPSGERLAVKVSGTDDIIIDFTYGESQAFAGGLWRIKSGDPDTAEIGKDLEVTGGARFVEGTGASVLDLAGLAGSLRLPDESVANGAGVCNLANEGILRRNQSTTPPTVEICYDNAGVWSWANVSTGSTSMVQLVDDDTTVRVDDTAGTITMTINGSNVATIDVNAADMGSLNVTTSGVLTAGQIRTGSNASGTILIGDGTSYVSGTVSGDATLAAGGALTIANDAINADKIATDAVGSDEIATDAVGSDEISTDAVASDEIATDAVGNDEIATDAVDSDEIAADAVGSSEIATDAVDSDEIATDAVDSDEIAADAVGSSEISTDAVGSDEIAGNAVGTSELDIGTSTGGNCLKVNGGTIHLEACGASGGGDGIGTDGLSDVLANSSSGGGDDIFSLSDIYNVDRIAVGTSTVAGTEALEVSGNAFVTGTMAIGSSAVSGSLQLDVTGDVGAARYCDAAGLNCFTPLDAASAITRDTFLELTDTPPPGSYTGLGGYLVRINGSGTALEFVDASSVTGGGAINLDDLGDVLHDTATDFDGDGLNNDDNLFIGHEAISLTGTPPADQGARNLAIGATALDAVTQGDGNVAIGYDALTANVTGGGNTAIGDGALSSNTGASNTAIGSSALQNSTGSANTAIGDDAMQGSTTGSGNVVIGIQTLDGLNEGDNNNVIGLRSGRNNTTGSNNNILGANSFTQNTSGSENIGIGSTVLRNNETGERNIAIGQQAMGNNPAANGDMDDNIALGFRAGFNLSGAATEGDGANNNLMLGYQAGDLTTFGDNNVIIGYDVDASSATASQELNLGGILFGNLGDDPATAGVTEMPNIGIGVSNAKAIDASALLELNSTIRGFLPPRMTEAERDSIGTPATGLLIFATDAGTGGLLQFFDGTSWVNVGGGGAVGDDGDWLLDTINGDVSTALNVGIGTDAPAGILQVQGADDTNEVVSFLAGTDNVPTGDTSMRVGIGTAAPIAPLHINADNPDLVLEFSSTPVPWMDIQFRDNGTLIGSISMNNTSTRMAIDPARDGSGSLWLLGDYVAVERSLSVGQTSAPNASAVLHASSTTQGFLPPRMTEIERNNIVTPATGLLVYNTDRNTLDYYDGMGWVSFVSSASTFDRLQDFGDDTWIDVDSTGDGTVNTTVFGNNGAQSMIIDAAREVGIGSMTDPLATLHIRDPDASADTLVRIDASAATVAPTSVIEIRDLPANRGKGIDWIRSNNDLQARLYGHTGASGTPAFMFMSVGETDDTQFLIRTQGVETDTSDGNAAELTYTVNKPTSGNDTGLLIAKTDTASLGESLLIRGVTNAVRQFDIDDDGNMYLRSGLGLGVLNPNANAILDITSTDRGFLPPRMTTAERDAMDDSYTVAEAGMVIFATDAGTAGLLQFFDGTNWVDVGSGGAVVSSPTEIIDEDGDTWVRTQEDDGSDNDIIRFAANNIERLRVEPIGAFGMLIAGADNFGGNAHFFFSQPDNANSTPTFRVGRLIGGDGYGFGNEITVAGGSFGFASGNGNARETSATNTFVSWIGAENADVTASHVAAFIAETNENIQLNTANTFNVIGMSGLINPDTSGLTYLAPDASAALDIASTTKGFLPPRMTVAERDLIAGGSPATGLLIFATDAGTSGLLQFYDGASWVDVGAGGAAGDDGDWFLEAGVDVSTNLNVGIGTDTPARTLHVLEDSPATNNVTNVLRLTSTNDGTGTISNNKGVGVEFAVETSNNNSEVGALIEARAVNVGLGGENFDLRFATMRSGAAPTEKMRIGGDIYILERLRLHPDSGNFTVAVARSGDNMVLDARSGVRFETLADQHSFIGQNIAGFGDLNPDAHLEVSARGSTGGNILLLSSNDNLDGDILTVSEAGNVGIGSNSLDASALLQLTSTTRGFLPPRMTVAERDLIAGGSPATGLLVFATDAGTGGLLQFYDGTSWVDVGGGGVAVSTALNDLSDAFLVTDVDYDGVNGLDDDNMALGHEFAALDGISPGARNTAIGPTALDGLTTGDGNVAMGYNAGTAITTGSDNVLIGRNAGAANVSMSDMVAIGVNAGASATATAFGGPIFIGGNAGDAVSTNAAAVIAIGYNALTGATGGNASNTTAVGQAALFAAGVSVPVRGNTALGDFAGGYLISGDDNVFLGAGAGAGDISAFNWVGEQNVMIGRNVGAGLVGNTSDNNTMIGFEAGATLQAGANNILIGQGADVSGASVSNELNIGNTLYGYLNDDRIGIGALPSTGIELDVTGDIEYTGTLTDVSDRRLKTDIEQLSTEDIIAKLSQINTYSFRMADEENGRTEYGVMAQDLERLFPELVHTAQDEMGTKSVNYVGLIAPMIEATKALKSENDDLKAKLAELRAQQTEVLAAIDTLRTDVRGMKVHTGYGLSQANMTLSMLLLLLLGGAVLVVTTRRQNKPST